MCTHTHAETGHRASSIASSAEHFFGDSEFLDSKDALRIALGIEDSASQPIFLNLHLPAPFNRILWIENLDTYYYFTIEQDNGHPLLAGQALAYVQGFKGASPRLRELRHRILAFSGMTHLAGETVKLVDDAQTPICFFGDADFPDLPFWPRFAKLIPMLQAGRQGMNSSSSSLPKDTDTIPNKQANQDSPSSPPRDAPMPTQPSDPSWPRPDA